MRQIENEKVVFENEKIRRELIFQNGKPVSSVLIRKDSGFGWEGNEGADVLAFPGFQWENAKTYFLPEENTLLFKSNYQVRWVFTLYDRIPAIKTSLFVKGKSIEKTAGVLQDKDASGVETGKKNVPEEIPEITERVFHKGKHLSLRTVRFFDRTDVCDSLVRETDSYLYRAKEGFTGNLFIASDPVFRESCILLKEAPAGIAHLNKTSEDLIADYGSLTVTGSGIDFTNLEEEEEEAGYPVTVLLCEKNRETEEAVCRALYRTSHGGFRRYILSNNWGDRSQDKAVCEAFITEEILRAKRLGVDTVQIDDGWQKGRSANSAIAKSKVWSEGFYQTDPDFWAVDPVKFPRGFEPLCRLAKEKGISMALWFSPDLKNGYENWEKDVETLMGFYERYDIRLFKFDGMVISDKKTERRFFQMAETLKQRSNGKISANLDITAGKRPGYFYYKEFGTLFVENRYTDWGNYYPCNTFRTLWQLSRFIPAEKLLFEVLNLRRNGDQYLLSDGTKDPLAPENYDEDYVFATVMAANPLIWMEMQHLNEEDTEELQKIIGIYKNVRKDFRDVIPTGECPDGFSLSGFCIKGEKHDYYIGIRELSEEDTIPISVKEILCTNDPGLLCNDSQVVFSEKNRYFLAVVR